MERHEEFSQDSDVTRSTYRIISLLAILALLLRVAWSTCELEDENE